MYFCLAVKEICITVQVKCRPFVFSVQGDNTLKGAVLRILIHHYGML